MSNRSDFYFQYSCIWTFFACYCISCSAKSNRATTVTLKTKINLPERHRTFHEMQWKWVVWHQLSWLEMCVCPTQKINTVSWFRVFGTSFPVLFWRLYLHAWCVTFHFLSSSAFLLPARPDILPQPAFPPHLTCSVFLPAYQHPWVEGARPQDSSVTYCQLLRLPEWRAAFHW